MVSDIAKITIWNFFHCILVKDFKIHSYFNDTKFKIFSNDVANQVLLNIIHVHVQILLTNFYLRRLLFYNKLEINCLAANNFCDHARCRSCGKLDTRYIWGLFHSKNNLQWQGFCKPCENFSLRNKSWFFKDEYSYNVIDTIKNQTVSL